MNANLHAYEALVVEGGTPAFAHEQLDGVQPEQLLVGPAASPVAAYAMLAGLWLWHNGLMTITHHQAMALIVQTPLVLFDFSHPPPARSPPAAPGGLRHEECHRVAERLPGPVQMCYCP